MSEHRCVTVLAGGWSASSFDLTRLPGFVIAVNDAAIHSDRWDACVSMDRLWHENRWAWIVRQTRPIYLRRQSVKSVDLSAAPHVVAFEGDHKSFRLSDEQGHLHGTHSGLCAINLAYQMRPARLYLVGMDLARGPDDQAHWFPQYPWVNRPHATGVGRFREWSLQMEHVAAQLREAGIATYMAGGGGFPFPTIGKRRLENDAS